MLHINSHVRNKAGVCLNQVRNMKKKIAVFANGFGLEPLNALIKGFTDADVNNEYDFFVFISYASYDSSEESNLGELNIYRLPDLKDYDAAIVMTNALNSVETGIATVKRCVEAELPVFSVGIDIEGAVNINIDNVTGIKELTNHLIEEHNVKRAVVIGGYKTHPESITRVDTIKQVFADHGLSIADGDIHYGDWGNVKTVEIAIKLAEDPKGLPDAIIAANDIMALACATELTHLGYKIPEDVIITGYDYVPKGQVYYPVLSTVDSGFEAIGLECYKTLAEHLGGKLMKMKINMCSRPVIGESCGCCKDDFYDNKRREYGRTTYLKYLDRETLEASESKLTHLITDSDDYKELSERLVDYYKENHDFVGSGFCLVINNKFFSDVMAEPEEVYEDGQDGGPMQAIIAIDKDFNVSTGIPANKNHLVPGYDPESPDSHIYFLLPLHAGRYNYGYIITSGSAKLVKEYLDLHSYTEKLMLAFRIQRSNIQLKIYNDSLRKISEIDTMTGLYNRLGYENKATSIYNNCVRTGSRLMVMFIDINRMKRINDVFGHLNGDAAIRLTASSIKSNLRDEWIAVRFGGDEFLVIGDVKNEEGAQSFKEDVLESVSKFNHEGNWPFRLSVSCGYIISDEGEYKPLQDYIKEADDFMYETKKKMHSEKS